MGKGERDAYMHPKAMDSVPIFRDTYSHLQPLYIHYRKRLSCRVSGALPSVLFWALGKDAFAECFFF